MIFSIFFISHEILPFLDLFPSQTPCSSLSCHRRIKAKPDLESLCKTVFRMSNFQYSRIMLKGQTIAIHEEEKNRLKCRCTPLAEL